MAIKKTQMYRKNLDTSETNLYPLTEAQYVSMENGQTVQEILSDRDSDKYTPVITNSSSTFKVGQGDNVDLSSSMKEGAYDSCVLKGKTMVNCIQEPSSKDVVLPYEFEEGQYVTINDTKESGTLGVELKGQTLVNLVKKLNNDNVGYGNEAWKIQGSGQVAYSYDVNKGIILSNTVQGSMVLDYMNLSSFKPNTEYTLFVDVNWNGVGVAPHLTVISTREIRLNNGFNIIKFTSVPDLTVQYMCLRLGYAGTVTVGCEYTFNNIMVLEGDWTNVDIPYFEGMTSCKMPTLHTVGKNLITQSFINTLCNLDNWEGTGAYRNNRKAGELLALFPSNSYVTQVPALTIPANFYPIIYLSYQDESSVSNGHILASGLYNNNTDSEMVCPERQWRFSVNSKNVVVRGYVNKWNQENMNKLKTVMTQNIQMETGTTTTTYEQGKSSILSLPEEVVLRGIGDVKDTLNLTTGEYVQRIGSITANELEASDYYKADLELENTIQFGMLARGREKLRAKPSAISVCNVIPVMFGNDDVFHARVDGGTPYGSFTIWMDKTKLETEDVFGLIKWLRDNNAVIQYELATPIVTKINLSSTLKSWNTTTHIYSEIPENTLYPILSHSNPTYPVILKPSTKYSIVANSYSNGHTNSAINFNLGGATTSTTVGSRVTTITTPSTLTSEELVMSGRGNKLNNVMVIEGDVVGDEPYFEGICDCKSPILSNVGKNLFNLNQALDVNNWTVYPSKPYRSIAFKVKPKTTYSLSCSTNVNVGNGGHFGIFPRGGYYATEDGGWNTSLHWGVSSGATKTTFTTLDQEMYYMSLYFDSGFTQDNVTNFFMNRVTDIQIEESSSATSYEPYKSNILSCETYFDEATQSDKTIVLRSLPNGVCDTLNIETGEYVQRIGEVVLDGSQTIETWWNTTSTVGVRVNIPTMKNISNMICDRLPVKYYRDINNNTYDTEGIASWDVGNSVYFRILKSKLETEDINGVKKYLAINPITVQYELETPIVSTIDVQGFPYAYTNGHVQLSSGSIEQSLTPKVEYSLSANKTGQIDSNTRQVVRQQKQLDDFEAMMLTSLVESAYDKAILQFDYEMQMMSLGGE